jgi:hypothetical protein
MIVWKMINRLATTAQKTPAGWCGTVLPLKRRSTHINREDSELYSRNIIAVHHRCIIATIVGLEGVDSLDVHDHDKNGTAEDQDEGDQTEHPNAIQAHELNYLNEIMLMNSKLIGSFRNSLALGGNMLDESVLASLMIQWSLRLKNLCA